MKKNKIQLIFGIILLFLFLLIATLMLDKEKKVLLKDANVEQIELFIRKNVQ